MQSRPQRNSPQGWGTLPRRGALLVAVALFAIPAVALAGGLAERIDRLVVEGVGLAADELAPRCGDAVFLRRAHLDLVGSIPTPDEVRAFLADARPDKRRRVVRELLDRPEFGLTQARYWRDVILSRRLEDRALLVNDALVRDLAAWFNEDRPWDEIAREFVTATGPIRDNGATAIVMAQDGRTEDIAAEVSRVFLGVQIQCAQCHDHPWDSWKREQFHELAAFFPRVGVRPTLQSKPPQFAVVVNDRRDLPRFRKKDNANRRGAPEHYMEDLARPEAEGTRMTPRFFLTGATAPVGASDAVRRAALAEALTGDEWFATAMVNRVWSELVGEGFYEPVDDLGPERTPSAPRAVRLLATKFADSGYDVKRLYATILATEAYQRESRPRRAPEAKPFAASVAQPLRADQLFDATLAAIGLDEATVNRARRGQSLVQAAMGAPLRQALLTPRMAFASVFAYDPSDPRSSIAPSIPQTLARMNTPALNQALRADRGSMLATLLADHPRDDPYANGAVIDELYLRILTRIPTDGERSEALAYRGETATRAAAMEDLAWALLNSAEFSHRR